MESIEEFEFVARVFPALAGDNALDLLLRWAEHNNGLVTAEVLDNGDVDGIFEGTWEQFDRWMMDVHLHMIGVIVKPKETGDGAQ